MDVVSLHGMETPCGKTSAAKQQQYK